MASTQLCLLIDNHDAGERGHLLVRGWWSQVTRHQKTGQNPLLLLRLGDAPSSPAVAVGGRGETPADGTGSGLLVGIGRCLQAGSTARGGGEQRSRSDGELQVTETRRDWDA